jgi:EmrB/QacA subfamily drug resistance transporter
LSAGKIANPSPPRRLGLILGILVTAQFVVVLDFSIVQIALPTIRTDLNMSLPDLQWIVSAYGLTFAGFLMFSGRASDIYGRKMLFMIGLVVFSLSSLAAGLAPSELVLIASRVVQGIGAALASATGLSMIVRTFGPLGRLTQVLGVFTAVSASGFSVGVVLGGVLTEALGWRWIFFVNVPIGIVVSALAIKFLPDPAGPQSEHRHLDLPGAVSVTAGLMLLVYGLTDVGNGDPSELTYAVLLLSAAVLALFVVIEHLSSAPLMPLGFLRRRAVFFANSTALLAFGAFIFVIFLQTTYLQVLRSYSPLSAAAALLPGSLAYLFLGGFAAPRLVRRIGARRVLVGAMAFLTVGMLLFTQLSLTSSYLAFILPAQLVCVIGGSLAATASNILALSAAKPGEEGIASGLINTARQVGSPIGLAVAVYVIGVVTLGTGVSGPSSDIISGMRYAFLAAAVFAGLGVLTASLLKSNPAKARPV